MSPNLSKLQKNVSSKLSIIIPLGPNEPMPNSLLLQVQELLPRAEIIVVASEGRDEHLALENITLCFSKIGRAKQLNAGAGVAKNEFLWFLHADSILNEDIEKYLVQYLHSEKSLYYFDLAFQPWKKSMRAQELGAFIRSEFWGMPFGDQGFILSKTYFHQLEGFPLNCNYGEDHLLAWKVKHTGGKLCRIPLPLFTSARKYQEVGRLKLTLKYLKLTFLQALPEFLKLRY